MKKSILKSSQAGFTLIELAIVLGIIAILGGTTMATARSLQRRNLNNATLALQADIRLAKQMALIEGRRWRVQFEPGQRRYHIHPDRPSITEAPDVIYTTYLPNGVVFGHLPRASMEFLPRGTIGGGGHGAGQGFTMRLESGPYMQELRILPVTGRVRFCDINVTNC